MPEAAQGFRPLDDSRGPAFNKGPLAVVSEDPFGELQIYRYQLNPVTDWQHIVRLTQRSLRRKLIKRAWLVELNCCTFRPGPVLEPGDIKVTDDE
jgi:hypothetical protein